MGKIVFIIFGALVIANSSVLTLLVIINKLQSIVHNTVGGRNISPLLIIALPGFVVGIGLLKTKRWAAIVFALTLAICGTWLIVGSIGTVAFPWILINFAFGLAIFLPTVAAVKFWSVLT